VDDLQALAHTGFAHGAQAVQEGAADVDAAGAQGACAQHVLARANAAVHVDLDAVPHRLHDAGQALDAALGAIELASTVVGDDECVGARLHGQLGVAHVLDAFEDELATPAFLDPLHIAPVQRGVELAGRPARQTAHVAHAADVAHDIAKLAPWCAQHAQRPAWLGGDVDHVFDGQLGRRGQAVAQVFVALPQNLQVQREHQGAAVGGFGAVDQALDEGAVFHHVELEPKAFASMLGHVFDRANAHGRQGEWHTKLLGGAGGQNFTVGVLHAGQAGGGDGHRHGDR